MKKTLLHGLCAGAFALAGCASAPLHFHTLAPADPGERRAAPTASFALDVLPVGVPEQLDKRQIVVRHGDAGLDVLEGERWGSALGDEMRSAMSLQLASRLGAQDVAGLPSVDGRPVLRIKVQLRSFDAWPGDRVRLVADWDMAPAGTPGARRVCHSQLEEPTPGGVDAMVAGQQRLVARLAAEIAAATTAPASACKA